MTSNYKWRICLLDRFNIYPDKWNKDEAINLKGSTGFFEQNHLRKDAGTASIHFKGNECLNEKLVKANTGEFPVRRRSMKSEIALLSSYLLASGFG